MNRINIEDTKSFLEMLRIKNVSIVLGLLCFFRLTMPLYGAPLNDSILLAIPPAVAVLFLIIPFFFPLSFYIYKLAEREEEELMQSLQSMDEEDVESIKVLAKFRPIRGGRNTEWEIIPCNSFGYDDVIIKIVRSHRGDMVEDAHHIPKVKKFEKIRITSSLRMEGGEKWLVKIRAKQGVGRALPNIWRAFNWSRFASAKLPK